MDPLRGERILAFLTSQGLTGPRRLHAPEAASYRQLRQVHTEAYIDSLLETGALLRIVGQEVLKYPGTRHLTRPVGPNFFRRAAMSSLISSIYHCPRG